MADREIQVTLEIDTSAFDAAMSRFVASLPRFVAALDRINGWDEHHPKPLFIDGAAYHRRRRARARRRR